MTLDSNSSLVDKNTEDCLVVLNFCIKSNLPNTAFEIGRWLAAVAIEFSPEFGHNQPCYWQKPYLLTKYQHYKRLGYERIV